MQCYQQRHCNILMKTNKLAKQKGLSLKLLRAGEALLALGILATASLIHLSCASLYVDLTLTWPLAPCNSVSDTCALLLPVDCTFTKITPKGVVLSFLSCAFLSVDLSPQPITPAAHLDALAEARNVQPRIAQKPCDHILHPLVLRTLVSPAVSAALPN